MFLMSLRFSYEMTSLAGAGPRQHPSCSTALPTPLTVYQLWTNARDRLLSEPQNHADKVGDNKETIACCMYYHLLEMDGLVAGSLLYDRLRSRKLDITSVAHDGKKT